MESLAIQLPLPGRRMRAALRSGGAQARLQRALERSGGYVVLTGANSHTASMLLDSALAETPTYRTVRVSALASDPRRAIHMILDKEVDLQEDASQTELRSAFGDVLEKARSEGKPIVVVVEGADHASIEQLERLRNEIGVCPEAIEGVQVVLVGSRRLEETLEGPDAAAIASRIVARIDAPIWTLPSGPSDTIRVHRGLRMSILFAAGFCAGALLMVTTRLPLIGGIVDAVMSVATR